MNIELMRQWLNEIEGTPNDNKIRDKVFTIRYLTYILVYTKMYLL